jgi:hypothetical protein
MRGTCSVCKETTKINEYFEDSAVDSNINICWQCGDKILNGLAKSDVNLDMFKEYQYDQ